MINNETLSWKEREAYEKNFGGIVYKNGERGGLVFISAYGLKECCVKDDKTVWVTLVRSFAKTFTTNGECGGQENKTLKFKFILAPLDSGVDMAELQGMQDRLRAPFTAFASAAPLDHKPLLKYRTIFVSVQ